MPKYNVGGFTFSDEATAKVAARELKAVEYILNQLKDADDQDTLKLYNKIVAQKMFTTQVGLSFLDQLKGNLIKAGLLEEEKKAVKKEEKPKPVSTASATAVKKKKTDSVEKQIMHLKRVNTFLIAMCIALALCVLGMFYVSSTINSPNILNYEEEIINKYSQWEQDLTERENAVREKERSLQ